MQPLVLRPAYGEKRRKAPSIAESGLPGGGPADKGLSLDKDIPGTSTFNKPEGDIRETDKAEPGSIYRQDGPDDLAKPQDDPEGDQRHHEHFKPTQAPPGGRPKGDPTVTDYPYRDDKKDKHFASSGFVLEAYLAGTAHVYVVPVNTDDGIKVATKLDAIEEGLNPKFVERGRGCTASLKRVDVANKRWLFAVDCGNGPKVVRMMASKGTRTTKLPNMDLHLSCSCPAWRWLGPEHWSQEEQYLDGKPRGTASVPVIRDPEGQNRVCKHVAAVLTMVRPWQLGTKKPKSK
jgi:hypothetical protein